MRGVQAIAALTGLAMGCSGVVDGQSLLCPAGTTNTTTGCTPIERFDGGFIADAGRIQPDGGAADLIVDPLVVDFGFVPVGQFAEMSVEMLNPTSGIIDVTLTRRPTLPFSIDFPPAVLQLASLQRASFTVAFRPRQDGRFESQVVLSCGLGCRRTVQVIGLSSNRLIECAPVDFGAASVVRCNEAFVPCINVSPSALMIRGDRVEPSDAPFFVFARFPREVPPGAPFDVPVQFCPAFDGEFAASLFLDLETEAGFVEAFAAELFGRGGRPPVPCQIRTTPIDFGAVPIGGRVLRSSVIENVGGDRCAVTIVGLVPNSDPGFSVVMPMPGTSVVLEPAALFQVTAEFAPVAAGPFFAAISLMTGDPNNPMPIVPMSAVGDDSMNASYTITSSAGVPFPDTTGGTPIVWMGSADDGQATRSIPFPFEFLGVVQSVVHISTNGFVNFDGQNVGALGNHSLPQGMPPNALFALWWDDINPGAGGSVATRITGAAPNRTFWVDYVDVPLFGSMTATIQTSIALHESNVVDIYYGTLVNDPNRFFGATAGWENAIGTRGANALPCAPNCAATDWPTNTRFTYTPNAGP